MSMFEIIDAPLQQPAQKATNVSQTPLEDLITQYATEQQASSQYAAQIGCAVRSLQAFARLDRQKVGVPDDINRNLLIRWRGWILERKKRSPATWSNYRSHLFALLRWCQIHGWEAGTTLQNIKAANEVGLGKKTMELLPLRDTMRRTEAEDAGVTPGWFWVSVMKTLFFTGIRRRQLVGLTWGDIDRKRMTIHLRAEHSKTKREWTIPLSPALLPVLDDLQTRSTEAMSELMNRKPRREDQVFNVTLFAPSYRTNKRTGQPQKLMNESMVSSAFRRIHETTGMEISPHRFRHTFATQLAKEGNLRELQQILGHTNLSTTMGYVAPDVTRMRNMLGGLSL